MDTLAFRRVQPLLQRLKNVGIAMYSNVLTFSISKDRIKITQKLAPTVIFLDQCHSSEMLLIARPRNV